MRPIKQSFDFGITKTKTHRFKITLIDQCHFQIAQIILAFIVKKVTGKRRQFVGNIVIAINAGDFFNQIFGQGDIKTMAWRRGNQIFAL